MHMRSYEPSLFDWDMYQNLMSCELASIYGERSGSVVEC